MKSSREMWWLLLFISVQGSHFNGGTIRWAPINNSATTPPFQVLITQAYTYTLSQVTCSVGSLVGSNVYGSNFNLSCTLNCGATAAGYIAPPVLGYCTGTSPGLNLAFAQRSDIVALAANDHFSVSYGIMSTATQGYYRALTLSSGGTSATSHWNITTSIDIRSRSDNGLINTPPVTNIMSPQGIPLNVPTQIILPTLDLDGDDVRCRWSNSSLECGDVCFPTTIPATTTLLSTCVLNITGVSVSHWYCASIQVEDFIDASSTVAMSSIPIQFLIYVYAPQSCPKPSFSNNLTCVGVQVGIPYATTLTAINHCGSSSSILNIALQAFDGVVQGPLVQVNPSNTTLYAMNITYTPLFTQLGLQILCATALDNFNIPSDQYCITFIVGSTVAPSCYTTVTSTTTTSTATGTTSSTTVTTSSTTSPYTISSVSTTEWPLIGTLLGLVTLLALLVCFYCCYRHFWSAKVRHRRSHQANDEASCRSIDKSVIDTSVIAPPHRPYHVYDINANSARNWTNNQPETPNRTFSPTTVNNILHQSSVANRFRDREPMPKATRVTHYENSTGIDSNMFMSRHPLTTANSLRLPSSLVAKEAFQLEQHELPRVQTVPSNLNESQLHYFYELQTRSAMEHQSEMAMTLMHQQSRTRRRSVEFDKSVW